ncbi:MAG: AAA family ATPase [Candidatus Taylorbacteria bacterium RIFCSPHIGHO2_02_FULL_45_28]|uniref:AAA family ATPase n=1 Tax=Candidatus Taylorbacteria bacterium RIFCSPHIGHO2_12_FULL_45_16 TaxID=1802315 RepID=A0A1G2N1B8_9BACT|nr:MAG: AAA family ATPase [Candidatus Taylorbacteria bacterium RIFCSPHIGHO2_01_FULL_44_110]OHA25121.1 MAG: AAA family ATPase [Candidatus Taylorbacteria bacterium RIFCSPHIGHO2_02_FULL_45_28]OHA29001.1 MAG: AAA family ATPase [Candidatus Taylorbacteria bacterium RIFCSPHIGHO2_12_FULL_45_16]OHA33119.1 MAG: AAA family ATPase [Candidatus Taylorbacteria bacterium RIFCSPLOWO2_01_FULL_45_59]OHA39393.1 MAG: AAA family ATPase [Candidatus Taylorbacteria bacterium RIFCSPLOWO2_02_FULL_45_10b]OHA44343.1 MAG: 
MEPLASRIRPTTLKDFVGQAHLVGRNKPLRTAIEGKHLFSFILWGPPGTGKTTIARIYAKAVNARIYELSAVSAGKDDIKAIVNEPDTLLDQRPKVLFLDEIHRFNKAQQDYLLPFVESGKLTLIGATTENPSFEVISALLSRCRVFVLESLSEKNLVKIIERAKIKVPKDALQWLINLANGDARIAITALENTKRFYGSVTVDTLKSAFEHMFIRFDKKGEEHYDTISAYIKSLRAGDVDAAIYYLARMLAGGEDPKFIARRMIIFASEDIGLAQPTALVVANAVFNAVDVIGMPEAQINLAHGTTYLALAAKDRSAYDAYFEALDDVKKTGNISIPFKIRNAPTKLMKELNYGKGYEKYDKTGYLPEKLKGKKYLKRKGK